jgi:hypothetical protein
MNLYVFKEIHIFSQNPTVLVYDITENCQFGAKTDRNSLFLGRDPCIASRLSITVPYFNFYGFWKIPHFCSKSKGVAYGISENCQFRAKTDRNSVFLGRDPRIANLLSITVPYFNFYGFWKISQFCSKSMGVHTVLPKIASLQQKLIETPYFLVVTPVLRMGYL